MIKFNHVVTVDAPKGTVYAKKVCAGRDDQALDGIRKSGKSAIYVPIKEDKPVFKKAMAPVPVKTDDRVGKDVLRSIYKKTCFDPTKH